MFVYQYGKTTLAEYCDNESVNQSFMIHTVFCYSGYFLKFAKYLTAEIQSYVYRIHRIAQNVGGGKHWQIRRLFIDSPKFSHPNIVNTLKYNGKPTQFAKILPFTYTSRVISPKFHPTNILRYTVCLLVPTHNYAQILTCYVYLQ